MKKYIVATNTKLELLEDKVCSLMDEGYTTTGGIYIYEFMGNHVFMQAMILIPTISISSKPLIPHA